MEETEKHSTYILKTNFYIEIINAEYPLTETKKINIAASSFTEAEGKAIFLARNYMNVTKPEVITIEISGSIYLLETKMTHK